MKMRGQVWELGDRDEGMGMRDGCMDEGEGMEMRVLDKRIGMEMTKLVWE